MRPEESVNQLPLNSHVMTEQDGFWIRTRLILWVHAGQHVSYCGQGGSKKLKQLKTKTHSQGLSHLELGVGIGLECGVGTGLMHGAGTGLEHGVGTGLH